MYFTILTKGVQIRLFAESIRLLKEPSEDKNTVSSLQAMLVSTASRVGTGNIIGVSTAICLGGPGACFWMWVMCIIGAASAFIESTLAQIYKKKNDAGVGSAPNASASAKVSHPAKQGLVQTLSVYIDTLLLCTATALMCLSSGVERSEAVSGAPYVQNALSSVIGKAGPIFITISLVLFAFTTLLGNLYYVDNAIIYLNRKRQPSKKFMRLFHLACAVVIMIGAMIPMGAAWAMADITMGGMTLINLPCCMLLGKVAIDTLKDYEKQRKEGKDPVFYGRNVGISEEDLDFWK